MKTQSGFTLVQILFLIPILFSGGILIATCHALINKYTLIQRECRTAALEAQKILGESLKNLMDLNSPAKALRVEEQRLRTALIAARAFPPVAAVLQLKLNINLTQQGILRAKQELLIATAKTRSHSILSKLYKTIRFVHYTSPDLKVYKTPQNAIAPDHKPVPFFKEAQTIRVRWNLPLSDFIPEMIFKLFQSAEYPKNVKGSCAATLIQKGEVWNPKLHLAKF